MVEQAIENGAGGRHIAEQFAPFFDRSIRLEVIMVERFS
jgi:hypothetical protein